MSETGVSAEQVSEARRLLDAQEWINPPLLLSQHQIDAMRYNHCDSTVYGRSPTVDINMLEYCLKLNDADLEELMDDLDRERGKRIRNGSY